MLKRSLVIIALSFLFLGTYLKAEVKEYKLKVLKEYEHDDHAYTQGLFFYKSKLYETTGQYGKSSLRLLDLESGKVVKKILFANKYFVEGSVELNGIIYILTWLNKVLFTYNAKDLTYQKTYTFPKDGWGLTTNGQHLIASDGSSKLYFYNTKLELVKKIQVKYNGRKISMLNELEYIKGKIWANVYMTDMILIINPDNGEVEGIVDCSNLLPSEFKDENTDVLNGIAYNPMTDKIYITGKNWKKLYQIGLEEKGIVQY